MGTWQRIKCSIFGCIEVVMKDERGSFLGTQCLNCGETIRCSVLPPPTRPAPPMPECKPPREDGAALFTHEEIKALRDMLRAIPQPTHVTFTTQEGADHGDVTRIRNAPNIRRNV